MRNRTRIPLLWYISDKSTGYTVPDNKVQGANMWPDGPHVDPMNLAIRGNPDNTACDECVFIRVSVIYYQVIK